MKRTTATAVRAVSPRMTSAGKSRLSGLCATAHFTLRVLVVCCTQDGCHPIGMCLSIAGPSYLNVSLRLHRIK